MFSLCLRYTRTHFRTYKKAFATNTRSEDRLCRQKQLLSRLYEEIFMEQGLIVQGDSFGTRPKKMRISQRLLIRF